MRPSHVILIPVRRLALILLVACHSGAHPPAPRQASEAVAPAAASAPAEMAPGTAEPAAVAFPLDKLEAHFTAGSSAEALARYRRQEFPLAQAAAESAIADAKSEQERQHLRILLAVIKREQSDWAGAARLFAAAIADAPEIADYLHFEAARSFAQAGDAAAAKHAALVAKASPWASDMEFLLAEVARASDEHEEAVERYRKYLASAAAGLREEARYRLGESLQVLGKEDESQAEWRKLLVSAPVSSWAERVRAEHPGLEAGLSAEELMTRGMAYFVAMRNLKSEADFAAALKRSDLSPEQRCQALYHRAKSVFKERSYRRAAPLFEPAIRGCKASGNTDYEVKSAYVAGKAFSRARDHERAARHYAYIERYPEHSYADDARLRQAEEHTDLGHADKVTELLSSLPTKYPEGDMRTVAIWRLARRSYQERDYEQAVVRLRQQIELVPIETKWWAEGQAHYWLGRSLAHLGRGKEAAEAYEECIRRYPLTYYSMQAFNRLREDWPERYQEMSSAVKKAPSPWTHEIEARPIYGTPGFRAALALARLGLAKPARRQLAAIGFTVPAGRQPVSDPDRLDWLVATSMLLDLAGDYESSHWIGRWHTVDYRRAWPSGDNAIRWRLAYPLAFWGLLQEFADKYTYPAHLQMAIVREESAFDPDRESYANAVGLTQMIFPTARDHAKDSGIVVTRENLQHPVKNVTIGSHFLQSLQRAFDGRVGLMVPGYNAGRARVRGWIRGRHRYALDEFIERIKGDQARRYTKRVLGSFFTYRYLSDGTVPVIRNDVPRRLGRRNWRKRK